jgi:hypothetical protein
MRSIRRFRQDDSGVHNGDSMWGTVSYGLCGDYRSMVRVALHVIDVVGMEVNLRMN